MIDVSPEIVSLACIFAVFFGVIAIFALRHAYDGRNRKSGKTWLFEKWQENIYNTVFKKDAKYVAKSIGMDVEKYLHQCRLNRRNPDLKRIVIDKIVGFIIIAIGGIFGLITLKPILIIAGLFLGFPFIALPEYIVDSGAKKRRFRMAEELPRFLDMLHTALIIGLPVEQAIEITSENLPGTVLAEEFLRSLADTKVGASSWQKSLEKLSSDYEVDVLSDCVLDVTNAYNNGTSIVESVARKSKDIKQANLLTMKERAAKLTSTILFPILMFKILPILAIMCIPIIQQLNSSMLGF